MSEEFSDDFVLEEEADAGASRSFLIAAGSMILIFIILAGILLVYFIGQRGEESDQVAAAEATNQAILAQNALVTQTVAAQQTIAAQPTNTPVPPTAVPPTSTPELVPTREQVAPEAAATEETGEGGAVSDADATATASADATATAGALVAAASPTPMPGSDQLPQTGASTWVIAVAVVGLVALLVIARRLRTI